MSDVLINQQQEPGSRRDFLFYATGAVAVVTTGAAIWPLINSFNPSADVAALSVVNIDLDGVAPGSRITVKWQGKPVFIDHRLEERIELARADDNLEMPDPELDADRVQRPEWLVVVGVCTHLGCIPLGQGSNDITGEWQGWYCPCHGSHYDTSGRIRKGPAPRNLDVPPYQFVSDTLIKIG
ncbi:ubiquinol-cytochrome c reductase iron-sulfur subunit [Aliiroseovarius sp. KMU-50]|uniref:Ubiquinol-cytochrome c reductase iron-sulfur subunit n=1 Tax=Aliiroseovarius salicola TaxID=3009082 RepID=A0ABT4W5K1_9RHOB|nr:ubiquinol-cytochrome c reductase iron-sulfur subunit [Aliiroseovarius sp. KMU-50]MDA5095788.1 ubiquinol-cytochrome c reductase iron-sulfur subunit [Aliiroseovarius sp. KMU-50]